MYFLFFFSWWSFIHCVYVWCCSVSLTKWLALWMTSLNLDRLLQLAYTLVGRSIWWSKANQGLSFEGRRWFLDIWSWSINYTCICCSMFWFNNIPVPSHLSHMVNGRTSTRLVNAPIIYLWPSYLPMKSLSFWMVIWMALLVMWVAYKLMSIQAPLFWLSLWYWRC